MKDATPPTFRRVLLVNHTARISGAELSLLDLINRHDPRRFRPIVACPPGPLARRVRALGVTHLPVRLKRIRRSRNVRDLVGDLLRVSSASLQLARMIRRRHIDVVHANAATAHLAAGPAARLARVPVVWHVRDLVELGPLGHVLFRLAGAVACVSECVEAHVARYGDDRDKVWTVTNGIDLAAFRAAAHPGAVRAEFGIRAEAPVVTQVSQITPWKGHRFLLAAVARLRCEFPELRVLLVGEPMTPEDADYLTRLRAETEALGLAEAVCFAGRRTDVASVIADSDVVTLVSRAEPFGRAALEAMALGKPVIGTRAGGLPELVSHRQTGLLVDHGDVDTLVDAIGALLRSADMRRYLGENAAADAERFDVTRTVNQIQNLYDDLLEDRGPKRLTARRNSLP